MRSGVPKPSMDPWIQRLSRDDNSIASNGMVRSCSDIKQKQGKSFHHSIQYQRSCCRTEYKIQHCSVPAQFKDWDELPPDTSSRSVTKTGINSHEKQQAGLVFYPLLNLGTFFRGCHPHSNTNRVFFARKFPRATVGVLTAGH